MSHRNKPSTSKFLGEDEFEKKRNKRPGTPAIPDQAIEENLADVKKRKISQNQSKNGILQKIKGTIDNQIKSRQQCSDLMLNNLSELLTQLDADYSVMREKQDELVKLTGALMKSIQQSNAVQKQKLESFWEMYSTSRKGCDNMTKIQEKQNKKLYEDMEEDLKNFEEKIIKETKRNTWDNLRKTLFEAMQNDL